MSDFGQGDLYNDVGSAWNACAQQTIQFLYDLVNGVGFTGFDVILTTYAGFNAFLVTYTFDTESEFYYYAFQDIRVGETAPLRYVAERMGIQVVYQQEMDPSLFGAFEGAYDAYISPVRESIINSLVTRGVASTPVVTLTTMGMYTTAQILGAMTASDDWESFVLIDYIRLWENDPLDRFNLRYRDGPTLPSLPTTSSPVSALQRIAQATEDIAAGDTSVAINYGTATYSVKGGTTTS